MATHICRTVLHLSRGVRKLPPF
ncbi:MAG: hypothetical protein DMF21_00130 [Verrucomicrobia bacterium]|nr:MAG: hypothetical protein DMF21_00130 [Verrucomicrobiota bacterium]